MGLSSGTRLAQYEIVELLGSGGMGEVYRARDERLGRDVAIKVLPEHLARDPEMHDRFAREARAVAALSHPGILAIHEFGIADGRSFAVMELLEGENLRGRLAQGPLHWRKASEMAIDVADALVAAHTKGIVHRDLKPENIFITRENRIKVLDFGLARTIPVAGHNLSSAATMIVTIPGTVMGTVGYMAPEQVRGRDVGIPADIFGLGCILFEMVTGRGPFTRDSAAETFAAILRERPAPFKSVGVDAPANLERVIEHCLEKKPSDRFPSASDVHLALKALLSDSSVGSNASLRRRHRAPTRSIAVLPFVNIGGDATTEFIGYGITESIINSLSQLPRLRVVPRSTVFRYKGDDVNVKTAGLALNASTLVTGRVVHRGDMLNIQAELVDTATERQLWGDQYRFQTADMFSLQEEIAWQISEALRMKLSGEERRRLKARPTQNVEAYQDYLRGRYHWQKWTPEDFKKAVEHFERAIHADPTYALAYSGLSDAYGTMAYYGTLPPKAAMPRARAAALKALELDDGLAEAHTTMGLAYLFGEWDWRNAEREFREAVRLNPKYALGRFFLALYLGARGQHDEALAEARAAVDADPLSPIVQAGVAWAHYFARRYDDAAEAVRALLQLEPGFTEGYNILLCVHEMRGEFDDASKIMPHVARFWGLDPDATVDLGAAVSSGGPAAYWNGRLSMLHAIARIRDLPPHAFAYVHAQMGNLDAAFAALDQMADERWGGFVFLNVDPSLDPLRTDPRFDRYQHRVGIPAATHSLSTPQMSSR